MEAKDIVAKEVARQAEFGCEPSWEDFVIAGQKAGARVDRELPDNVCINDDGEDFTIGYKLSQQDMLRAGFN